MAVQLHSIHIKHIVYSTPDKVFEALTKPSVLQKWIEGNVVFELKTNGNVELFDGWMKGTVIHFTKDKTFAYTWKPSTWDKKAKASTVEFNLKKVAAGTEVEIIHTDFPSEKEAGSHEQGWINFVLDPLNDYFIGQMTE